MTKPTFSEKLQAGAILVSDGATGTNLQARGLAKGMSAERWVLDNPEQIVKLHRDFIEAGSDIILTCTFGGSEIRLAHSDLADRAEEINTRAVELARQAAQGTDVFVAGSIGPTGQMLKPLGPMEEQDAVAAYASQARYLTKAGVDFLVIETQFDLAEAQAALKGTRSVSSLPVVLSFSYDRGTRTMMGVRPAQVVKQFSNAGLAALGINCGRALDENLEALKQLRESTNLPIWFKPNAGLPKLDVEGNPTYEVTPDIMGSHVADWLENGAQIVGGCCGNSPAHLRAIARAAKA